MRKSLAIALSLSMVATLFTGSVSAMASSESSAEAGSKEVIVFAAASMTETLNTIIENYKSVAPDVTIKPSYGSSGDLVKQIKEGADCDIFISAGQRQMNQIDASKDADGGNTDGLDIVLQGTRINLLENKVALCVPDGNPANINSFDDLAAALTAGGEFLFAMGGADVPVGQYTDKILAYYCLDKEALLNAGSITLGDDVKAVTSYITEATVDAGVIYQTDAFSAGLTPVDTATAEMCGQVIYPAALMNTTDVQEEAQAFLDYLTSADCDEVFKAVGFSPIEPEVDYGEGEVIVFAAASMTETLNKIIENYKEVAPDVTITPSFGSSGDLVKQIKEGADCDLFISAGQKQMNQIDASKDADGGNTDGLDIVLQGTRLNRLENKVALCVPEGNTANINSFDDLAAALTAGGEFLFAMGGADVPVGQYTDKILAFYGLDKEALLNAGNITLGDDVKAVTSYITEATVNAGVIYQTDAFSAGLTPVDTATAEMCGQVIYPAAVMNTTANETAAKAFLQYLTTDDCDAIFAEVGFTPLG